MQVFISIGFLLGLTSSLAIILAIANSKWKVFEDPRIDDVQDMLPGSNCGACGFPGCRVFAENVVAGDVQPSGCTVGGPDTANVVADYLGVDAGEIEKTVARLLCAGGSNVAIQMAEYEGHATCRSASAVVGGGKGCHYGCLGYGDCGDCVDICPKDILQLLPLKQNLIVQCNSELKGDEMIDLCRVACTGCERCVADASQGLLKMKHNLPALNYDLLDLQSTEATRRCPTGAIVWVEGNQFQGNDKVGSNVATQIGDTS